MSSHHTKAGGKCLGQLQREATRSLPANPSAGASSKAQHCKKFYKLPLTCCCQSTYLGCRVPAPLPWVCPQIRSHRMIGIPELSRKAGIRSKHPDCTSQRALRRCIPAFCFAGPLRSGPVSNHQHTARVHHMACVLVHLKLEVGYDMMWPFGHLALFFV